MYVHKKNYIYLKKKQYVEKGYCDTKKKHAVKKVDFLSNTFNLF